MTVLLSLASFLLLYFCFFVALHPSVLPGNVFFFCCTFSSALAPHFPLSPSRSSLGRSGTGVLMPACMASLCGVGLVVLSACLYVLRMIVYDFVSYVLVPVLITI